jgi:putative membrane protein
MGALDASQFQKEHLAWSIPDPRGAHRHRGFLFLYNEYMHWIAKLALITAGNAFALWLANTYITGFSLSAPVLGLITIALTLTVLNFTLKPVLTILFSPIIILTLGLGLIIVNAIVLKALEYLANHLDFMHGSISIESIPALILATLIISVVNFIIHLAT